VTPGSWNYEPISNQWKFENINADGTKTTYTDQWINTENAQGEKVWYTVDKDGNMVTGWLKSDGEIYFMSTDPNSRGELVKGTVMIDGKTYTFDEETGVLVSGDAPTGNLTVLGATNHVAGVDGVWKTYDTGEMYFVKYFDMPDGTRLEIPPSDWFMIDGHYYFFDKYGIPQTGLIVYDDKYYYLKEDGTMQEGGEVTIGDLIYVLDKATGACRTMRQK
jgi:glucan-binding YG repeat protein